MWEQRIGEARIDIEMARLLCLKAADMMDRAGSRTAQLEIAMIKVAAPRMALKVIDDAIQAHGYAGIRTLRIADGPDEVHLRSVARLELARHGERLRAWRESTPPSPASLQLAPMMVAAPAHSQPV